MYERGASWQRNLVSSSPGLCLCLRWCSKVVISARKGSGTKVCGQWWLSEKNTGPRNGEV